MESDQRNQTDSVDRDEQSKDPVAWWSSYRPRCETFPEQNHQSHGARRINNMRNPLGYKPLRCRIKYIAANRYNGCRVERKPAKRERNRQEKYEMSNGLHPYFLFGFGQMLNLGSHSDFACDELAFSSSVLDSVGSASSNPNSLPLSTAGMPSAIHIGSGPSIR